MSCLQLAKDGEMAVVRNLRALGHTHLFFLCNYFDLVRKESDRQDLQRIADERLVPMTDLGRDGVHFVSALQALDGRLESNSVLLERSGLPSLEAHLQRFLTRERGRIKVLQPSKQLSDIIAETQAVIPQRETMFRTGRETLEERYHNVRAPLDQLNVQRANIGKRIANFRSDMRDRTRQEAWAFYVGLEGNVPAWIKDYEVKTPFNLFSADFFSPKGGVERVVMEVTNHLSALIEQESSDWQRETMQPFLTSRCEDLKNELDTLARQFLSDTEAIKLEILGLARPDVTGDIDAGNISPLERILSAAGSIWLMDPVGAGVGYAFGFKAMIGNLALQVGFLIAGVVIGITNPVALFAMMFAGGGLAALFRAVKTNDDIKKKVGERFAEKIRSRPRNVRPYCGQGLSKAGGD